jgi:hypothetical protein
VGDRPSLIALAAAQRFLSAAAVHRLLATRDLDDGSWSMARVVLAIVIAAFLAACAAEVKGPSAELKFPRIRSPVGLLSAGSGQEG